MRQNIVTPDLIRGPGATTSHEDAAGERAWMPDQVRHDGFGDGASRLAGFAGAFLGWAPDAFWAATPAELACVVRAMTGDEAVPLARGDLAMLMEAFPDG